MQFGTCRHLATNDNLQAVVQETLGELERVVGMHISRGISRVVHTDGKVQRTQGIACNLVDFRIKERAECTIHTEGSRVAVSQIHARGEHGDGQLTTLFDTHRHQLVVELHVLGSIQRECHAHVVKRLGDDNATVEDNAAADTVGTGHASSDALCGLDVQRRIHRFARKLDIRAVLNGKGLERNDGQRILHLTV